MVELNTAVGTLGHEREEQQLEELIAQLSQYSEALRDYRERLREKGIDTEGTMSVFAKRLKNGRSWSDIGLEKMSDIMVALRDNLVIEMIYGDLQSEINKAENKTEEKPPKHFIEKLTKQEQREIT